MKHHYRSKARRHSAALRFVSGEANKITALIATLRNSMRDIDRASARGSDTALMEALDTRRANLSVTIAALEDRLSAIQGLIKLDRPEIAHRMH